VTLYGVLKKHKLGGAPTAVMAGVAMIGWFALIVCEIVYLFYPDLVKLDGIYAVAWVFYLGMVTIITATRVQIRNFYGIHGNPIEDFFATLLAYPCVMIQLETVSKEGGIAPLMPDNREGNGDVITNQPKQMEDTMA